jgi:biotin operon repressor
MAEFPANPTDAAICRLLAVEPLPTAAIADRLGASERTVRHRLYRLRQAGAVVTGPDGLHSLAGSAPPTDPPGTLPAWAAPVMDLAAPLRHDLAAGPLPTPAVSTVAAKAVEPLPTLARPAVATGPRASDGPSAIRGGRRRALDVFATAVLGLAMAGGIAVMVRTRRISSPPPAPPTWSGDAGDPWGSMRGPS